jgi:hypothetical protein
LGDAAVGDAPSGQDLERKTGFRGLPGQRRFVYSALPNVPSMYAL